MNLRVVQLDMILLLIIMVAILSKVFATGLDGVSYQMWVRIDKTQANSKCRSDGWNSLSLLKCSSACTMTKCAGFAISTTAQGGQLCVFISSPDQLPQGFWTVYKRKGR